MALRIGDLTAATVLVSTHELELSITGSGGSRKITVANFFASIPVAITTASPLGGIGYAAGAGGQVTQATNKSTGVTLNTMCGRITMNAAALAAGAIISFTVTNSSVLIRDNVCVTMGSGGSAVSYQAWVEQCSDGAFHMVVKNVSAGSLSEAVEIYFAIIRGVIA